MVEILKNISEEIINHPITTTAALIAIVSSIFAFIFFINNDFFDKEPVMPEINNTTTIPIDGNDSNKINNNTDNLPPKLYKLSPDKHSPQYEGTTITWIANASDKNNDPLVYKFFLSGPSTGNMWVDETGWIPANTWIWTTSAEDTGNNEVRVWVRDGKNAGPESRDDSISETFIVNKLNQKLTITSLTPNKPSPQYAGTIVTWTAIASDQGNGPLFYRFLLKGPSTGNQWAEQTQWDSGYTWQWITTKADIGSNVVEVQARDGNQIGPNSFDDSETTRFEIKTPASIALPMPYIDIITPSNPEVGKDVRFTGHAELCSDGSKIRTYELSSDLDGDLNPGSHSLPSFSFKFKSPGDHNLTFRVIDYKNRQNSVYKNIKVSPTS